MRLDLIYVIKYDWIDKSSRQEYMYYDLPYRKYGERPDGCTNYYQFHKEYYIFGYCPNCRVVGTGINAPSRVLDEYNIGDQISCNNCNALFTVTEIAEHANDFEWEMFVGEVNE